jgi:hypothetical protein
MKVEVKNSGTKHWINIIPSNIGRVGDSVRGTPNHGQGNQLLHWHIKNPFAKEK